MNATRFQCWIGYDEETAEWSVIIQSEGQHNAFKRPSLKLAMKEAERRMHKREVQNRRFPLGKIVAPNGARQRLAAAVNYGG